MMDTVEQIAHVFLIAIYLIVCPAFIIVMYFIICRIDDKIDKVEKELKEHYKSEKP